METARDFISFEDHGQGTAPAPASGVDGALAVLRDVSATAVEDVACWGLKAASDFAGSVEELSRTVEYLQVVAASAVDRARKQSAADPGKAGTSWTTGWREDAAEAATGVGPSSGTLDGAPGPRRLPGSRPVQPRPQRGAARPMTRARVRWMTGTGTRRSSCGRGC